MNVHIPPSPARGGPPRAPYNLKTTIFPGVSIADYSSDRLQFAPDLSRIICPPNGKFDTFAFINPWLAHDVRPEECYWEVTLLTKGLCQIGAAVITQATRMLGPFLPDPVKGDGVGDVGFSIGFDLSRSTAFISNKHRDQPPKYPFTWYYFATQRRSVVL